MGLGYWEELSFGKIAERWSAELADKPNGFTHDEILSELVADLWRGRFEDDAGKTCLTLPAVYEDDKTFNRRDLLTAFRSDVYPPQSVARWELVRDKVLWEELAAVPLGEYREVFRKAYLMSLHIPRRDFGQWCEKHPDELRPKFWRELAPPTTSTPANAGLTNKARAKGGSKTKRSTALQQAINLIGDILTHQDKKVTLGQLTGWLDENSSPELPFSFDPPISGCNDIYRDGQKLVWQDSDGKPCGMSLRSLEPYLKEAKHRSSK